MNRALNTTLPNTERSAKLGNGKIVGRALPTTLPDTVSSMLVAAQTTSGCRMSTARENVRSADERRGESSDGWADVGEGRTCQREGKGKEEEKKERRKETMSVKAGSKSKKRERGKEGEGSTW